VRASLTTMTREGENPMGRASHLFLTVIALALGLTVSLLSVRGDDSGTVQLTVTASTVSGHALHYHWRATDGNIENVDARTTHWKLPGGPGIHFAYVLIEDECSISRRGA
jgi:hypothetical protein